VLSSTSEPFGHRYEKPFPARLLVMPGSLSERQTSGGGTSSASVDTGKVIPTGVARETGVVPRLTILP
jgi:hypothetical protein